MLNRLIVLILLLTVVPMAQAQYLEAVEARLEPGSAIMIDGTSTVNSFTCRAGDVDGRATLPSAASSAQDADVVIVVPVRSFDCGKRRMNSDMQEALKADEHPSIRFELDRADVAEAVNSSSEHRLIVQGRLFIAGTERPISLPVTGRAESEGRMTVEGEVALLMSDFGIDPPSALLGMVQAHDRIVVRFDLDARLIGEKRVVQNITSRSRP